MTYYLQIESWQNVKFWQAERRDCMNQQIGKGSLCFSEAPFIIGTASVVGTKEGEGPLAEEFDCICGELEI